MKISRHFQNIKRARDFAAIKTYIETGKRHEINPVGLLQKAVQGEVMTLEQMRKHQLDQA